MTPHLFIDVALAPALRMLPVSMGSPSAMAMVVAICLQESQLTYRRQIGGPAHGYAQFERLGGDRGVLTHPASRDHARSVCLRLDIVPTIDAVYVAIEFNDVLCCALARLLLWTLPQAMPPADDPQAGWLAYASAWRPGKPHRATWDVFYEQAWVAVADATKEEEK